MEKERIDKFENMLAAIQSEYDVTTTKMDELKAKDKTKSVTYKQLIAKKLMLQNMLNYYDIYGLI